MLLHIERREASREVTLIGEADAASAPELQIALNDLSPDGDVVIDVTDLEFLDAAGLRVILRSAERVSGEVFLRSPRGIVRRLLETAGVGSSGNLRVISAGSPAG